MATQTTQINVTQETAAFIEALNVLEYAKVNYLRALTMLYGEEQGGNFYNQENELFERLTDNVAHYMAISMATNMGLGELTKKTLNKI